MKVTLVRGRAIYLAAIRKTIFSKKRIDHREHKIPPSETHFCSTCELGGVTVTNKFV